MKLPTIFRRREPEVETRAVATGYTAAVLSAREAYISGASGLAELTATVQSCVSLWENGLTVADVEGTDLLDRRSLALAGRSLALRGECVFLIDERGLIPCSDWEMRTRLGKPTAYRLTIPEIGGSITQTALAGELLHFVIGADPGAPYFGQSPLRRSSLSAGLLHTIERALSDVYARANLGAMTFAVEGIGDEQFNALKTDFQGGGRRGETLLLAVDPSHSHPQPATIQPRDLSPDISRALLKESHEASRDAIAAAFGVLPAMLNASTTGPMVREGQRHLASWQLQPIAELIAEECSAKLATDVSIDTLRPLQAFDAGGRARAAESVVRLFAQAKEAGVDPKQALQLVDWAAE